MTLSKIINATKDLSNDIIELYDKFDNFYDENNHIIAPIITLTNDIIRSLVVMRPKKERNIFDYGDLFFSIRDSYLEFKGGKHIQDCFKLWDSSIISPRLVPFVVALLKSAISAENIKIIKTIGNDKAYILLYSGIYFGWVDYGCKTEKSEEGILFIKRNDSELSEVECKQIIADLFWKKIETNCALFICGHNRNIKAVKDRDADKYFPTKKSLEVQDLIDKFFLKNLNRSILFYGPPGSGKTNLVKSIINGNNLRSVKFESLNIFPIYLIEDILELINPNCLIIEDIDHADHVNIKGFLEKLEILAQKIKLILATANRVEFLVEKSDDSAIIRPGRFDLLIEINKLDPDIIKNIVGNDSEIFEKVKNWPVKFILELMDRIRVLGRKEALKLSFDLEERFKYITDTNYGIFGRNKPKKGLKNLSQFNHFDQNLIASPSGVLPIRPIMKAATKTKSKKYRFKDGERHLYRT